MSDDYLWDRSGEPDPEIQRLEEVLGRLSPRPPAPEWPAQPKILAMPAGWGQPHWRAAIAASIALVVAASWLATRPAGNGWKVVRVAGAPLVGSSLIRETGQLRVGEWLETDAKSRAKLTVTNIGELELEPNSRLGLVQARETGHRLALAHGAMHASIWAPSRFFSVETPAAVAVDLGCEYTLHVDRAGNTTLDVTFGWVGFEQAGHESWVPAGARCVMRPGSQPGTPFFTDAPEAFRTALDRFDFEHDHGALDSVLTAARKNDTLTLWHLLPKLKGVEQSRVYERMAVLAPPPAGVTRDGILNGNRVMLDLWWDQLGFGDSSLWRLWKGPSPFERK